MKTVLEGLFYGGGGIPTGGKPPFRPRRTLRAPALALLLVRIPPLNSIPTKKGATGTFFVGTEEEGFEPPCPCGQTVFKTASL